MTHSLIPFIGVTGGIGSGKSMICRIFSCLGIPVFEADKQAKIILNENEMVKKSIKELLGNQAYTDNEEYNPSWVKAKIKDDPRLIPLINSIVHPAVRKKAIEWQLSQKNMPFLVYESALIHGKNKPEIITKLIVINADKADRIKRIHMRDTSHTTDINTIMNAQPSEETYLEGADFIIKNSHNDVIWPQVEKIYKSITGLTLVLFLLLNTCSIPVFSQIKAMTFNIRMDTPSDGVNQWKFRTKNCAALIKYNQADFIGMQEAFIHQIKDISLELPNYAWFGKGRDDGKESGEFSPLFYNKIKFTLMKEKTFWLSDSCDKVGFGWDAACRRVVTWGYFKENKTGKKFYVFNTHFDHLGKVARRESAKLVLKKIKEIAGKSPVILTGDFNATPEDEPIKIILNTEDDNKLIDAEKISKNGHYGPYGTFNAFKSEQLGKHIDYVFVKNGVSCSQHTTHSETWESKFPSDHFPVSAVLHLP